MRRSFTYIDNSNLHVEGCRVAAVRKHLPGAWTIFDAMSNHVVDMTWRLNYERLRDFIIGVDAEGKIACKSACKTDHLIRGNSVEI